ncbi:MAG: MATE family efflux transporter [Clostridia bacterium]
MKRENNLGTDKIFPLLLKLTIPSMIAQFVNVLYGIVDRIYISNIADIGNLALAGVGVCAPIVTLITSFCYLIALGGAPLIAIKLGEGNKQQAQKIMANCFVSLLVTSVVITIVFLCVKNPMLRAFGASPNIFGYANEYLTIYLYGTVFALLSLGLNSFITCQGFSKIAMASIFVGAISNIILDPIFIFTFKLGVKGAAIATVISQALSCLWVMSFLLGKRSQVHLSFKNLDFRVVKKVMSLGVSPFFIMMTESVIIIGLNAVLQKFGGAEGDNLIAGATIAVSFMQLIIMPLGGITMGAQPVISFNFGAKQFERITLAFKYLVVLCFIFLAVMFTIAMTMSQYFIKIFTDDQTISQIAMKGIKYYTYGILFLTFQYPIVDAFTALGCAKHAIFLSLIRKLGFLLPLTFILPIFYGAMSAFLAETIADIIGGTLSIIVFVISIKRIYRRREAENTIGELEPVQLKVEQ